MKSMRFFQRAALAQRQLFLEGQPALRQTLRQLQQTSQQPFRTRPLLQNAPTKRSLHTFQRGNSSATTNTFTQSFRSRRKPNPSSRRYNSSSGTTDSPSESLSFSQRMKKLSREYGWSALGVYLLLTALDFPFCFLAVRLLGTDRIGHWEHVILETVRGWMKWPLPEAAKEQVDAAGDLVQAQVEQVGIGAEGKRILEESSETHRMEGIEDHGYAEAEKANRGADASIWTQLGLAYVIHKSFIFVRVPLTAAVTPKVVKTLRGWGWNIGKMPSRRAITSGPGKATTGSGATGVNTKGSKVKPDD